MAIQTPIRGLRSFCVAAKCLSFKQAAEQLFITPSAVSHQIRQLESQLNIQLFKRQTRSVQLTRDGLAFYKAVQPIIEDLEQTIDSFTNRQSHTRISITTPEFFASELLVPRLSDWAEQYPDIELTVETVKSGKHHDVETDLSVVLTSTPPPNSLYFPLFALHYVPACNPDLHDKLASMGYEALKEVPLILHKERPWAWHQWAESCGLEDFEPQKIVQLDSMFSVARAAQQGLGIALIPMPISQAWFAEKALVRLFENNYNTKDHYFLIQHEWHESRTEIPLFVDWMLMQLKK